MRPAARTVALYEQIRKDRFVGSDGPPIPGIVICASANPPCTEMLNHLKQLQTTLVEVQRQLRRAIQTMELTVNGQR